MSKFFFSLRHINSLIIYKNTQKLDSQIYIYNYHLSCPKTAKSAFLNNYNKYYRRRYSLAQHISTHSKIKTVVIIIFNHWLWQFN